MPDFYDRYHDPAPPAPEPNPAPGGRPDTPVATGFTCAGCGYNLTGVVIGGACPECGASVEQSLVAGRSPLSGLAIASMVLGIVSVTMSTIGCLCSGPILGFPCGIAGLVCWQLARNPIRQGQVSPGSRSMNTAGLVCSLIGVTLSTVFIGLMVSMILANP